MSKEELSTSDLLNTEQTLLYALEQAGEIKAVDEIAEPVDRIIGRAALSDKKFAEDNEIIVRKENKSLHELKTQEDTRSEIQQTITRMINERMVMTVDETRALRNWGKWYSGKFGIPHVQEILRGLILPEKDSILPRISDDASDLAPDVYWMMLKEQEEVKKNSELVDVA